MTALDQMRALLYKTFVLQLRQIKSNIFQLAITVLLVLIPAMIFMNYDPRDGRSNFSSFPQLTFNKSSSFQETCSGLRDDLCSKYFTQAVFVNPPNGPSAGNPITNTSKTDFSGILGAIPQFYTEFYNYTSEENVVNLTPQFAQFDTPTDMTDYILQQITLLNEYGIPNIGFEFNTISYTDAQLEFTMLSPYFPDNYYVNYDIANVYPSPYYYALYYENMIANGFITNVTGKTVELMPTVQAFFGNETSPPYSSEGLVGFLFISPSLCLLLPVYVFAIVVEKSNKSLELNKLMKLNMMYYWLSNFITGYILYLLPFSLVVLVGFFFQIGFISDSWSASILLFAVWGLAQISLGFFLSTLFGKERLATIISYAIVFGSLIVAVIINLFIFKSGGAVWWYMLWPAWAFIRGFYLIQNRFVNIYFPPLTLSNTSFDSEFYYCIYYLLAETIFFFILAVYLEMVMPREWGISKKVYFPITDLYRFFKRLLNKNSRNNPDKLIEDDQDSDSDDENDKSIPREVYINNSINNNFNNNNNSNNNNNNNNNLIVEEDLILQEKKKEEREEDSSIKLEKKRAKSKDNEKYLLRCVNVSKKFGAKKALKKVYLAVEEGECFGLLGPNGAGKTTLISIISGIISPSSGYCCIAGKYTNTSDTSYRDEIGICPQFDILWEDLTIREHLNYYFLLSTRKKGEKLHVLVNQIAERVCLIDHMDKKVKSLSGGMKRKLSIAISLVGDPKLLLLDEPTTGLDPDARREVWDLLSDARVGRSMIITTHNMEEADILSTRIGIVTQGKLSCVGNQQYLKNRFGKGYNLTIATTGAFSAQKIIDFMKFTYPNSILDSFYSNILMFVIPIDELNIADLFVTMRNRKDDLGIKEWGLNQSSLEEVFLNLVRQDEGEGDIPS